MFFIVFPKFKNLKRLLILLFCTFELSVQVLNVILHFKFRVNEFDATEFQGDVEKLGKF